jgi:hypothetical protein
MPETDKTTREDADAAASRTRELVQEAAERVARDEAYSEKTVTVPATPPAAVPNGSYSQRNYR